MDITDLEKVVAILGTFVALYFAYRKLMANVEDKIAAKAHEHTIAELESQAKFREQLMTQNSEYMRQINLQTERINTQDDQIAALMKMAQSQQAKKERCEEELGFAYSKIHSLELLVGTKINDATVKDKIQDSGQ